MLNDNKPILFIYPTDMHDQTIPMPKNVMYVDSFPSSIDIFLVCALNLENRYAQYSKIKVFNEATGEEVSINEEFQRVTFDNISNIHRMRECTSFIIVEKIRNAKIPKNGTYRIETTIFRTQDDRQVRDGDTAVDNMSSWFIVDERG